MNRLAAVFAACLSFVSAPVLAQSSPVVVELFTSQGCSSCPAADALMHDLAARDDVIPLALHVDYWDYIGWKDKFARAAHTKRQKAYAAEAGRRMIYTPQMVINGRDDVVGVKAMKLANLIAAHKETAALVTVSARKQAGRVLVELAPIGAGAGQGDALTIHLVQYSPQQSVHITRGENAGRTISYANVVFGWTVLGEWSGRDVLTLEGDLEHDLPAVVMVQRAGPGQILAAAQAK